ncbi:MAG: L-2-hydroxyglutarate oxidase [Leptospirales bacterium]
MKTTITTDYLIIGAGIMGLALAREIKETIPSATVAVIEKENVPAVHASGRNSGVLHAGFYYTSDSLKARFTREGNLFWREYCQEKGLPMNPCGKVVVARNESESAGILELKKRGDKNGVDVTLVDEKELVEIEPNARTTGIALWSPTTTSIDPVVISRSLEKDLVLSGVQFFYGTPYLKKLEPHTILAGKTIFSYRTVINAAGLYADHVARDFGFSSETTILPFKGIYLEYETSGREEESLPIKTNIYPVPDLGQPFLGVHYTIKVDGTIKIGPTAIPALWRENYAGLSGFSFQELKEILGWEASLFLTNDFGFRDLALTEIQKYRKGYMASQATRLVKKIDSTRFSRWGKPGIRAQLLNRKTRKLISDFLVEGDRESIHVLNAVSPAFTASVPFARWILEKYHSGEGWGIAP